MKIKISSLVVSLVMIPTSLWMISCDNQKGSFENNFIFQGEYDSLNKAKVLKYIKYEYVRSNKEEFESNSGIEKFEAYEFKTEEVDTAEVLTSIKLILENQKFLLNYILPDSIKDDYLDKALKAHDDSLIYFYTNFHGYRISYYYYLIYEDEEMIPDVFFHVLWVDTNSNVVLESIPYALNIILKDEQPLARHEQRKMFVKKYWPDSLPNDIDSNALKKYFQHKN